MEVFEQKVSDLFRKYTGENSSSFDQESFESELKSVLDTSLKVKEIFQKGRKDRLNAEHQVCQLEKQVISLNKKLGKDAEELSKLRARVEEADEKLTHKHEQVRKLDDEKTDAISKYNFSNNEKKQLEDEKATLLEVLEKKSKEIERLDNEWKSMSQKLSEATKANYEAQAKLDEFQSGDITREFKLKRLEQEKDLLSSQNAHLTTQLNGKTEELSTLKRNKTSEVLDLQNLADSQKNQLESVTKSCESYKAKLEEQESKMETLMEKLKRARGELADTDSTMTQELNAKNKLVELYKESSEDSQKQISEMTFALLEIQKILKETDEEKSALEAKLALEEEKHKEKLNELEERLKTLDTELENANELLEVARKKTPALSKEAVEGMSPTAATASALMKKGMTLTQIYSEYVEVSDALELEKDENTRLKQYLDQILQEIEEKAPLLQRQREDYENALKTIENLTAKFDDAMNECERSQSEKDDYARKADFTKRENERMNRLCIDLSQQVRVLLKEVEEARGGVVSTEYKVPELISSDKVSSSSQVISEHLVSFKNIEDLQEQNQKLLTVVRDLSEEREKQEKECSVEKMSELSDQLNLAFEQVKQMKDEREKQNEIIETLVKQRDMYKVLYNAEERPEISSTSFLQQSTMASAETEADLEKAKAHLTRITEDFEKYKTDSTAKESSLQTKLEKLEDEVSKLRSENQHGKGKIEFLEEKNDSLKRTNDGLTRESEALVMKSRGLETAVSKQQKEAAFYKQELEAANEKLINLEVALKSSDTEKRLMKGTEQRLMQENKTLIEQQRSQNVLLTNLQTIQNNLERQEFETRKALGKQVEELQLEMKGLTRNLDAQEANKKTSIGSLNHQLEKLQKELSEEKKLRQDSEKKLNEIMTEFDAAKLKCTELEEHLASSEARLKAIVEADDSSATENIQQIKEQHEEKEKSFQSKLSETELRMKALSSQAQSSSKHVEQYKQIAASCEEALKDANEKYAILQKETSSKLQSMQQRANELSRQLEATKVELATRKSKAEKKEQELSAQLNSARQSYVSLEREYNAVKGSIESSSQHSEAAKADAKMYAAAATEKQEKYERELVLHAKDVEELVKVKEELHEYAKRIDSSENHAREAQEKMVVAEKAMENMKIHHAEEMKKIREHSKQISEQNSLLHKEIEKLSSQIVDAKSRRVDEITKLSEETGKSAEQSTEDLYEVIRFIRREKEIAETKFEALQSESLRYRQRCDHFEKELEETQAALELERKRTLGLMLSKEEHEDIMAKVARVAELTELNKELEKQKEELGKKHSTVNAKVKQLEDQIKSMKEGRRSLEEEKGSWFAEKTALKSEIQRWTTRAQQLIEQNKKATTELEELKPLKNTKAQNDKVMGALKDEIVRLKAQKEAASKDSLKLKKDLSEMQDKAALLTTLADTIKAEKEQLVKRTADEIEVLKKDVAAKETHVTVANAKFEKLKIRALKYQGLIKELQKSKEASVEAGSAPQSETNVDNQKLAELEKENAQLKSNVERLEKEVQKNVEDHAAKSGESAQGSDESSEKLSQLSEENAKLSKEVEEKATVLSERDENEKKMKKILRSAKEKMKDLNAQVDKSTNENMELKNAIKELEEKHQTVESEFKEKEMRFTAMKSQFDSKAEKMKATLNELKNENQSLSDRIRNLEEDKKQSDERSNELAKAIADAEETISKLKSQAAIKHVQDIAVSEAAAFTPLTATVRPTASTSNNQPQKPMSSRTASIRPLIPAQTPTAMVSPTVPPIQQTTTQVVIPQHPSRAAGASTASVAPEQRMHEAPSASNRGQASVFKAPRVLASVQAQEGTSGSDTQATVTPIIAGTEEGRSDEAEELEGVSSEQMRPSEIIDIADSLLTDVGGPMFVAGEEQVENEDQAERDGLTQGSDMPSSTSVSEAQGYSSVEQAGFEAGRFMDESGYSQDATTAKRRRSAESPTQREEDEEMDESPEEKRQRVEEDTETRESEVISISDGDGEEEEFEEGEVDDDEEEVEENEGSEGSVEEIEDEDSEEDEEEAEDAEFDYDGTGEAFDEEEEEEMEGEEMEEEENQDEEDMDDQGNDMEEEEEDSNVNEQQSSSQQERLTTITPPMYLREPNRETHRRQPSPAAFMLAAQDQSGRGRVFRRRYQLPSFSLPPGQGGSGPFDEADDCTVPSTPTLYEPKRSDGFAEAVSSPQVRHPVFSFPSGSEGGNRSSQSVGLDSGVNDEGLRLDDTRIDLLAGEEPASVPLTTIGVVPSGRPRESSTARVPELTTEDNNTEQNVPQHIDLTADDEDDDNPDAQDVPTQDDDDLFEDIAPPTESMEDAAVQEDQDADQAKEEPEEAEIKLQLQEQQSESTANKEDDASQEAPQSIEESVTTRSAASSGRRASGRRPRIRRTALPTRGRPAEEKPEGT
ncbi:nucleoprotein TPR-like isoform X2 [Rhopilema esculentum]|uniref:nucleoprotein TPR-like isoform X2 n=1 Tax=Rhopilema esculentum TaxID=499914 RepID=UPI0031DACF80